MRLCNRKALRCKEGQNFGVEVEFSGSFDNGNDNLRIH